MPEATPIYIHINPFEFDFSSELDESLWTTSELPCYTQYSIQQTKKFCSSEIHLITKSTVKQFESEITKFFNLCKAGFPSFYTDPFWFITTVRLYVLYLYAEKYKINNFFHLENDNVIYASPTAFERLSEGCYFSQVGPEMGSAGIMYVNNINSLASVVCNLTKLITKGENKIRKFTNYSQLSEMIMIDLLVRGNKAEYLPLFPTDKFFDSTNCVFDGASYGQYLGGTNNGDSPGWFAQWHHLGQLLAKQEISVSLENGIPGGILKNKRFSIFNLHIHSKKLDLFVQ